MRKTQSPLPMLLVVGGVVAVWYLFLRKPTAAGATAAPAMTPAVVLNLLEAQRAAEVGV